MDERKMKVNVERLRSALRSELVNAGIDVRGIRTNEIFERYIRYSITVGFDLTREEEKNPSWDPRPNFPSESGDPIPPEFPPGQC